MDDQEEAKEASKRLFGKGVVKEEEGDESLWNDPNARVQSLLNFRNWQNLWSRGKIMKFMMILVQKIHIGLIMIPVTRK
jgi:hypothetical protein